MASVKVKLRPATDTRCPGTILYQITHEKQVRSIASGHTLFPAEWNGARAAVIIHGDSARQEHLLTVSRGIQSDLDRLMRIISRFSRSGRPFTSEGIAAEYRRYCREYTLFQYMGSIITRLQANGKIRTSETYSATLSSFRKFRKGKDIMLDSLTANIMEEYEAWHRQRGIRPNTISFYNRILRAVYNRAVENGIIDNRYPFRHVYTGIDKTVKRALPITVIKKIRQLELTREPSAAYARDMFMLSFMLRGMSFIDMALLRSTDLREGRISYRRRKTGQLLEVKWTPEMQAIVDRHSPCMRGYLLPIIRGKHPDVRIEYRNVAYSINYNLRKIAARLGLSAPFTMYAARHSWATVARAKGIPLSVISEGMGHGSEATTQIYLASLDTTAIDRANSLILRSLQL